MGLKCDGTHAETRFLLSAKRTSPFKSAGASVQSTTGSRGVHISGSNAGYTMFRDSVKGTGYPFHSPVSPSLPLPCVTMCHHISTGLYHAVSVAEGVETLRNVFISTKILKVHIFAFPWKRAVLLAAKDVWRPIVQRNHCSVSMSTMFGWTTILRIQSCRSHKFEWNGSRLLEYPRRYKHYANASHCNVVLYCLPSLRL